MNRKAALIVIILVIAGLAALALLRAKQSSVSDPNKLHVIASFYPLAFFAQQIGGDKVEVTTITPAGAEPHDYEPTAQDVARIEDSKLLIINGNGFESWGTNIKPPNTLVVSAGDGFAGIDPHVWLSPPLAQQMVDKITQGFKQVDSANADYYQNNADSLKRKLAALDIEYQQGLNRCDSRDIITSHAAFGRLATAYGLNQVPIAGLSPDAEPSARQLAQVADFARKNNIKYIFFESLVSPKLAETIAREVGAQTLVLNPIEGLTDSEIAQGKDYFTEMRSNLANLQLALQCRK